MEEETINLRLYGIGIIINGKFMVNTAKSLSYEEVCTIKKTMEEDKKRNSHIINKRQKTHKRRIT